MYVEMKNIVKKYGDFLASDHVSLGVEKGKLVALVRTVRQRKDNFTADDCRT